MGFFSPAVVAAFEKRTLVMATLVFFDFASNPMRVWPGPGRVRAGGHDWSGLGKLASISDIELPIGGSSPTVTFTLSGVDPITMQETMNAPEEVEGRDVTVFRQFYDGGTGARIDDPHASYLGVMDTMVAKFDGSSKVTIEVTAETPYLALGLPLWGALADADQKRLFPGDRGLEGQAQQPFKTAQFPIIDPPKSKGLF